MSDTQTLQPIRIYNTLTRRKEHFEPVREGHVGIYLCGPTVYKPSHIGHAVGPVIFDAIARYLSFRGFEVRWVVNITDVDDKLIDEAARQNRDMLEIAREIEDDYRQAMDALGVTHITDWPHATEYIHAIVETVGRLIHNGAAYEADGDVYFDHASKPDYGKLSGRKTDEALHGSRQLAGEGGKRHPADFAVWKASGEDEIGWDSPWGRGRPGWHIECSAMSMNILGETFDIHGGGMDLIFPHHENEIAQSEAASGRPFAKYWMHNGLTRVKTKASGGKRAEKMSKSLGNIRELRELLPAWGGETVRAFILSTHYRRPLDFSDEQLAATQKSLENFYRLFEDVERLSGQDPYATADAVDLRDAEWMQTVLADDARQIAPSVQGFFETMADDFNTAAAIAALHELRNIATQWRNDITHGVADERRTASVLQVAALVIALGRIVGLFERRPATKKVDLSEDEIQALIDERTAARENKDFARADAIRDELASKGVSLEDLPSGTIWRRA